MKRRILLTAFVFAALVTAIGAKAAPRLELPFAGQFRQSIHPIKR